jgi:hypothetical protein
VECFVSLAVLVAIAALASASIALAGGSHLISTSSIGKGKLGQTRAVYTAAYGKPTGTDNLEGGLTRLNYAGRVEVYFKTGTNSGRYIVTSAAAFRTAEKVGPCSKASAVKSAYKSALKVNLAGDEYAYRLGSKLWFEIEAGKVAAVALGSDKQAAWIASNAVSCGS